MHSGYSMTAVTIVIAVFLAVSMIGAYFLYVDNDWLSQYLVEPVADETTLRERLSDETRETLSEVYDLSRFERNNTEAIRVIEHTLATDKLSADDSGYLRATLAELYINTDRREGLRRYAEVYNDVDVSTDIRQAALLNALWYVVSHIGDGSMSAEDIQRHVLSADRFGSAFHLNEEDLGDVTDEVDMYSLMVAGFEQIADTVNSDMLRLAAESFRSRYVAVVMRYKYEADEITEATYNAQLMNVNTQLHQIERTLGDLISDEGRYSHYRNYFMISLYNVEHGFSFLHRLGYSSLADVERARERVVAYASKFPGEGGYFATVAVADANIQLACALVIAGEYDVASIDGERITQLLGSYYVLPSEDKNTRTNLAEISTDRNYTCYQPFIFIAQNIDPHLEDFLVDDVGSWTHAQFAR